MKTKVKALAVTVVIGTLRTKKPSVYPSLDWFVNKPRTTVNISTTTTKQNIIILFLSN